LSGVAALVERSVQATTTHQPGKKLTEQSPSTLGFEIFFIDPTHAQQNEKWE